MGHPAATHTAATGQPLPRADVHVGAPQAQEPEATRLIRGGAASHASRPLETAPQSLGIPFVGGVDAVPEYVTIAPVGVSSVVSTGPSVVSVPSAPTVTICTPVYPL